MATFGETVDRLLLDYLNRTDLLPEARRAVRNAIASFETHRFWFNEAMTALTTSAGQTFVTLPTDLLTLDRLELTISSADYQLHMRPFDDWRDWSVARTRGKPTDYAIHQNRAELFPIPDSAYSVPCYYVRSLTALSADSDTNTWTTEGQNLIVHTAAAEMLNFVLKGDPRDIQRHEMAARRAYSELQTRDVMRNTRAIRATQF